jgi:hypothetical protein
VKCGQNDYRNLWEDKIYFSNFKSGVTSVTNAEHSECQSEGRMDENMAWIISTSVTLLVKWEYYLDYATAFWYKMQDIICQNVAKFVPGCWLMGKKRILSLYIIWKLFDHAMNQYWNIMYLKKLCKLIKHNKNIWKINTI